MNSMSGINFKPFSFAGRLKPASWPFDAVSFVDVALLLTLFSLTQSSFVLQPAIRVELPESAFTDGVSYSPLVVTLAQEGMIFFNDERTTMEGLKSAFAQAAYDQKDAVLLIEADDRIDHGAIVSVYNMAVQAGIREVGIATRMPRARPATALD